MLVLHDSTANWLVKFITAIYEEVLFIHSPDLDLELLRAFRPAALWSFQIDATLHPAAAERHRRGRLRARLRDGEGRRGVGPSLPARLQGGVIRHGGPARISGKPAAPTRPKAAPSARGRANARRCRGSAARSLRA